MERSTKNGRAAGPFLYIMCMGAKMLMLLPSETTRMIRPKRRHCRHLCSAGFLQSPTISNFSMSSNQFFAACISLFLFSCTKVIQVDLNSANTNIVIEGIVSDAAGPYQVKLTQTVNFSDPNSFPPV